MIIAQTEHFQLQVCKTFGFFGYKYYGIVNRLYGVVEIKTPILARALTTLNDMQANMDGGKSDDGLKNKEEAS